jgi:DNA repair exonuclease SbcCD ATPase subunit
MRELESLFRQEASLRVAAEATESTLKELLDETIRPLAAEVDQRWKALFPGRGDLKTYSDGNITRTVNGYPLPYDSFSTAESMGATILLRLLVTQMATAADFCWFDEPLEHLDPDVRRKVASLLSRVTSGEGPLRQVVVTTYEEPLAHHLQARDEQRVRLLDVRQAG